MGQKINPHIFKLGINNHEWNSKYLEKTREESTVYTYNDIQIKKFILRFFNLYRLKLHSCKIRCNENYLDINISYYCPFEFFKKFRTIKHNYKIQLSNFSYSEIKKNFYKILIKHPKKRLKILKTYKNNEIKIYFKTSQILNFNYFTKLLIESLSLFTRNSLNINIIFQNLNKGLSLRLLNNQSKLFRKIVLRLRRFSNMFFFKETVNVILISIKKKHSAFFLSNFISEKLSFMKRHNIFFNFLKQALIVFVMSSLSNVDGIKILIKGRINGVPRAKKKLILVGNVTTQKIEKNLDYSETTSYTTNGTFGVKVWISEKIK